MTDIEIAKSVKPQPIEMIARSLGLKTNDLLFYGENVAKIKTKPTKARKNGRLILVTAMNSTKAGIGKTTLSIGVADALKLMGESVCLALREPSLGPVFGIKGGATGGGFSQVIPMEDINLHFTGDFHAIASANNLLCAYVDNHIFHGNALKVDETNIFVKRCLDMNERELRSIHLNGVKRDSGFVITAASEVMAILSVAKDLEDLKFRLGNILVALDKNGKPLYARDFKVHEAMTILLKDALKPNLVQSLGGTPALVHCGPFANIAHGCNSIIATQTALGLANYVVTEAGFGVDLGAEKFLDYKCRLLNRVPDAVVLVVTLEAIKLHGENGKISQTEEDKIISGAQNLLHHYNVLTNEFGLNTIVALNKHSNDKEDELNLLKNVVNPVEIVECEAWLKGGAGALDLASKIRQISASKHNFRFAYDINSSVEEKVNCIVKKVYGGKGAKYSIKAKEKLNIINKLGFSDLPIIIAKTQFSLTDDKKIVGAPKDFEIEVTDIEPHTGAGYITVICGNMMLLPGLNKEPAGNNMHIDKDGNIKGLF